MLLPLLSSQSQRDCEINHVGLLIHIGEVSGAYMKAFPQEVWRVNPDGELRDHFRKLKYVFQTEEEWFSVIMLLWMSRQKQKHFP